jgi:two-component system response regulator NreC
MPRIRVLIADDHGIVRAGLKMLIDAQPDMEVVGQASSVREMLRETARLAPDVLCLDLTMPDGSSLGSIPQVRRDSPSTRILVLTVHDEPAYLHAALAAGAQGYVVKTAAAVELLSAIRAVQDQRTFVDCNVAAVGFPTRSEAHPAGAALSQREREVLTLLAQGHTNQQVADRLFLSVKTIETYRSRINDKLGLRSRADLVRYALELGLIGPGSAASQTGAGPAASSEPVGDCPDKP